MQREEMDNKNQNDLENIQDKNNNPGPAFESISSRLTLHYS